MQKLIWILVMIYCHAASNLASQNYWSKHYDLDIGNDYATSVIPVDDGIILQATGFCDFNSRDCHALVKLDSVGNLLWKSIIYDSLETNGLSAFVIRNDTFLLSMAYLGVPGKTYSVLSFDNVGNYISRFDYNHDRPFSAGDLLIRPDGKVYVIFMARDDNSNKLFGYTRCYDPNWNFLWEVQTPENLAIHHTRRTVTRDSGLIIG